VALGDQRRERVVDRRGIRLVARHDLDLAAPQAGSDLEPRETAVELLLRDPQRRGDLRLRDPEQAQHPLLVFRAPRDRGLERLRLDRRLPHRVELARRAGKHEHGRASPLPRRHDHPRRRAGRLDHRPALGHQRLLAVRQPDRVLVEIRPALHQRLEDRPDPILERLVERQLAAGEASHHLERQVVGGRAEPAARDDQVDALAGHEVQLRLHVLGPVAADRDVGEVDAELAQAVGQPRAVAVAHPPRQHLGAGDDDPGARAHGPLTRMGAPRDRSARCPRAG
jgi:hypothetical protein